MGSKKAKSGTPVGGGDIPTGNVWSDEARAAAAEARKASMKAKDASQKSGKGTGLLDQRSKYMKMGEENKPGGHQIFAKFHEQEAATHDRIASSGHSPTPEKHEEAAGLHRAAAEAHRNAASIKSGTHNAYVSNPAVSESQRRYLNWEFGHDWVKEHGFDNKGPLPETVGTKNQGEGNMTGSGAPTAGPVTNPEQGPSASDFSMGAAHATLASQHGDAREHALSALDHSGKGNKISAARAHTKAAEEHECAATDCRKDGDSAGADEHDQAAALHRKAASMHKASITENRGDDMTPENRTKLIDGLVTNCGCQDRAELEQLTDNTLTSLVKTLVTNKKKDDDDDEDDVENAGEEVHSFDGPAKPGAGATQAGGKGGTLKGGDDSEYEPTEKRINPKLSSGPMGNRRTVVGKSREDLAVDAWLKDAPASVKSIVQNSRAIEKQAKLAIVRQLVANLDDNAERNRQGNELMQKPLKALKDELSRRGPTVNAVEPGYDFSSPMYFGAAAPAANAGQMSTEEERQQGAYEAPVLNMKEISEENARNNRKRA
jgi:hypothetical protein